MYLVCPMTHSLRLFLLLQSLRPIRQNALEYITMAALSKLFAVATTYPYQVVRARLQDQHNRYDGVVDVVRRTWRYASVVWSEWYTSDAFYKSDLALSG